MNPLRIALVLCSAAALLASQGSAQIVGGSIRSYDKSAPIDFEAARIEVRERQNEALFSGNVEVSQGTLDLAAETVRVLYNDDGSLSVDQLVADGGVTVRTPAENARAARAIYDVPRSLVTLIGGVRLERGGDTLSGERLVIDLNSGRSSIEGAVNAAGRQRVTGRFVPSLGD